MNKTEFLQGLGLARPEVEPEVIRVEGKHAKRVAPTKKRRLENSAAKAASTKQENDGLAELKASITELQEEKPKTLEELAATKDRLSELEEKVRAIEQATMESVSPPVPPDKTREVTNGGKEEGGKCEAAGHTETETTQCPKCEADVGWNNLEVQKVYLQLDWPWYIFFICDEVVSQFRECPECRFKEEIPIGSERLKSREEPAPVSEIGEEEDLG